MVAFTAFVCDVDLVLFLMTFCCADCQNGKDPIARILEVVQSGGREKGSH